MKKLLAIFVFLLLLAGSAQAAILFDCGGIAASTGADVTASFPTGIKTNDILILQVLVKDQDDTLTVSGFTQLNTVDRSTTARYWWYWMRYAGSGTDVLVDKSTATGATYARICSVRGAVTTGNFYEAIGSPETGTADPTVLTGVTSLTANALIMALVMGEDDNNASIATTGTDPAAYREQYGENATGTGATITWSYELRTTAGASGNISVDWNTAVPVGWGGLVLAVKSAGIGDVGATGTANSIVSSSSLVMTTSATVEVGNLHVIALAKDNASSSDGNTNECTSAQDSASNAYTKIYEYTYAESAANAGATVCAFYSIITSELASGGTATINFSDARTAKAMVGREFTLDSGTLTVLTSSVQTETTNGADAGSLAISGLSSKERLWLRANGYERAGVSLTPTAQFSSFGTATADNGSVDSTSMDITVEFLISPSTGETSDPTINFVAQSDGAGFFIPIEKADTTHPVAPIIF